MSCYDNIVSAREHAEFCRNNLQLDMKHASATEALLILPMIERAERLRQDIQALEEAIKSTM